MPARFRRLAGRENGVALILTLGVLSLLMVLAFSFALAAISARSGAKLEENITKARMETESRLQSVYNQMFIDFAVDDDDEHLFPATSSANGATAGPSGTAYEGRYFWYSTSNTDSDAIGEAMRVRIAGVEYFPDDDFSLHFPDAGWQHVYDPETGSRLVARYAYLVMDESGKIDPSAAVQPGVSEGQEANRLGIDTHEIDLGVALQDTPLAQYFEYEPGGALPAGLRWLSYYNIFNSDTQAHANSDSVLRVLFPDSYDIEAFDDSVLDKHRFNLGQGQAAWDAMIMADLDTGASAFWAGAQIAPNQSGIPWLYFGDARKKYQVMANLIDYCDSDDLPTTDYVAGSDPPSASYCGLEQVPAINEVLVTTYLQENSANPGTYEWYIALTPELVNLYTDTLTITGSTLDVGLTVEWVLDEEVQTPLDIRLQIVAEDLNSPSTAITIPAQSYFTYAGLGDFIAPKVDIGSETQLKIVDLQFTHLALFNADGALLDIVDESERASITGNSLVLDLSLLSSNFQSLNIEVNDPRHNQPKEQWKWGANWASGFGGTLGAVNGACDPAANSDPDADGLLDKDHEPTAVEPWDVSTAYIRNAPMESLWELGCIHRAGAWQTLNLKNYNQLASSTSGLANYEDGDGNILSQVKLDDRVRTSGRININTYSPDVLRALYAKVAVSSHFNSALSTDSILSSGGAGAMADSVLAFTQPTRGGTPFADRGEMAAAPAFIREWEGDAKGQFLISDAAMESVVGKTIGLTTVRQNYFTIVITTQIIQDVGGDGVDIYIRGTPARLRRFDPGIDQILARQRIMAILYRDALNNIYRLERFEYLHE